MADKSIFQFNEINDILDDDIIRMGRNNVDYKMTGQNFKNAIRPYYIYSALLKQQEPDTQTSGTLERGAKYTLTTYVSGDDFSNMELISGTVNTSGSVFRAITTAPTVYTNGSTLTYDGSPYVVSLDKNNVVNPLQNTLPVPVSFTYVSDGEFVMAFNYLSSKVHVLIGGSTTDGTIRAYQTGSDDGVVITTKDSTDTLANGILDYTSIEIKAYF